MIAYVLLKIGYYLGKELRDSYHEDREIIRALGNAFEMERIVLERNKQLKRWGFKLPDAIHYASWLTGALRNPVFLVVFRNPVAIARTISRRDPKFGGSGLQQLTAALEHGLHKMELGIGVIKTKAPSILVDVDAARGNSQRLVRDIANLFAPNTSDELIETIAQEINDGGYKSA
jgi:hypothetical protein